MWRCFPAKRLCLNSEEEDWKWPDLFSERKEQCYCMYSNDGRFKNEEGKLIKEQAPVTVIFAHAVKCGQALMFICICFLCLFFYYVLFWSKQECCCIFSHSVIWCNATTILCSSEYTYMSINIYIYMSIYKNVYSVRRLVVYILFYEN